MTITQLSVFLENKAGTLIEMLETLKQSKVFALEVENKPGGAAKAISTISKEGIGISYLYSFIVREKCLLIFRTDDAERAADVIRKAKLPTIDDDKLVEFA